MVMMVSHTDAVHYRVRLIDAIFAHDLHELLEHKCNRNEFTQLPKNGTKAAIFMLYNKEIKRFDFQVNT